MPYGHVGHASLSRAANTGSAFPARTSLLQEVSESKLASVRTLPFLHPTRARLLAAAGVSVLYVDPPLISPSPSLFRFRALVEYVICEFFAAPARTSPTSAAALSATGRDEISPARNPLLPGAREETSTGARAVVTVELSSKLTQSQRIITVIGGTPAAGEPPGGKTKKKFASEPLREHRAISARAPGEKEEVS